MIPVERTKPRVFLDADVLFAGAASPTEYGASLVILRMAEITLIEAVSSQQVITEVERNLSAKMPEALPAFQMLVKRCLLVTLDPILDDLIPHQGLADPKDLPILVAALSQGCPHLVTFNIRHYQPGHPQVAVLRPGEYIGRVRELLGRLKDRGG